MGDCTITIPGPLTVVIPGPLSGSIPGPIDASGTCDCPPPGGGGGSGGGNMRGLAAARPAPTGSGVLYFCDDLPIVYLDDPARSAWVQYGLHPQAGVAHAAVPPPASSFSLVGDIALGQMADALRATLFSNSSSKANCALLPIPSGALSAPFTITLSASFNAYPAASTPAIGLALATGLTLTDLAHIVQYYNNGTTGYGVNEITAFVGGAFAGEFNGNSNNATGTIDAPSNINLRLFYDGALLHYQCSSDCVHWWTIYAGPLPTGLNYWGFYMGEPATGAGICQAVIYKLALETTLPVAPVTVTAATNASPVVLTTSSPHGLQSGDLIAIEGLLGNTSANSPVAAGMLASDRIAKVVAPDQIAVYSGSGPVAGNGTYSSGGTVTCVSR